MIRKILFVGSLCLLTFGSFAQKKTINSGAVAQPVSKFRQWSEIRESEITIQGEREIVPQKYKVFKLASNFKDILFSAPHENTVELANSGLIIELPMPDGSFQRFKLVESPCMEKGLADQFPNIKTFNVKGVDEPGTYGKLDWTDFGFHGMLLRPEGNIFIDPYSRNNTVDYISYNVSDFVKDFSQMGRPACEGVIGNTNDNNPSNNAGKIGGTNSIATTGIFAGPTLRTYRLAVACTGEYAVAVTSPSAPTVSTVLSKITTSVNRVDGVYETEAAIKFVLVSNETAIIYTNASTDPFTGNNNGNTLINESQTVINSNITSANYDIGHTFSTGGGGIAQLGCVCTSGSKARGITGSPQPVGDPYDIDFVSHEMGHQFGSNHSYNQCTGNATQNAGTMVEPLSGITIMGYAGVCSTADNLSAHSIAYFHTISYDEVMTFSNNGNGNSCPTKPTTGNSAPVVTSSANFTIPKSTPFTLTGSATDPNGDALTFSWEEIDNNSSAHAGGTAAGNPSWAAPFFRNYAPTTSPSRNFPQQSVTMAGALTQLGEYLPSAATPTSTPLKFRLVARDNKMGGGGVSYNTTPTQITIAGSGPLAVTYPNVTGISWASNSSQTITWNVASTDQAPVSCANVAILLSVDAGVTWVTVLASTPNDGTQAITVPTQSVTKTACRIKIAAVGNIFYDINDKAFTITAGAAVAPVADFTGCNSNTALNSTITFTDASLNSPSSWNWVITPSTGWAFQNSTTAASQNPQIKFTAAGTYTIALTATNSAGNNTKTSTGCVVVSSTVVAPVANFSGCNSNFTVNNTVTFTDLSTNGPTSWSWAITPATGWTFQNATSATSQNPQVKFTVTGTYQIALTATNSAGSNTKTTAGCMVVVAASAGGCDTLSNIDAVDSVGAYPAQLFGATWGYISGMTDWVDRAKADKFLGTQYTAGNTLRGAYLWFYDWYYASSTSNVNMKVWDDDGTAAVPNTVLGTKNLLLNTIPSNGYVYVPFAAPISVSGDFYLGIEFNLNTGATAYAATDTVALVTNTIYNTANTAWEKWTNNVWHAFSETAAYEAKMSHAIFPVLCPITVGLENAADVDDFNLFPNPSNGMVSVMVGLNNESAVNITIFNALGQVVKTAKMQNGNGGKVDFDLSSCSNGVYFVEIQTGKSIVTKRLMLNR